MLKKANQPNNDFIKQHIRFSDPVNQSYFVILHIHQVIDNVFSDGFITFLKYYHYSIYFLTAMLNNIK